MLFLLLLTQQLYLCVLLNMAWNSYIDSKPPERSILRYSPFYFLPLNNHRFPFNYARIQKSGYNSTHRHPPASWGFSLCVCVHAHVCMFHKSSNRKEKHDHLLLDGKLSINGKGAFIYKRKSRVTWTTWLTITKYIMGTVRDNHISHKAVLWLL